MGRLATGPRSCPGGLVPRPTTKATELLRCVPNAPSWPQAPGSPGCPRCAEPTCRLPGNAGTHEGRGAKVQRPRALGARGPGGAEGRARAGCVRSGGRRCHITASAAAPSPSLVPGMRRTPARLPGPVMPAAEAELTPRSRPSATPARSAEPQAGAARTPVRLARRRVGRPGPRPRPRAPLQRPRGYLAATVGSGKDTLRRRSGSGNRDASHSLRCGFRPAPTRPRRPLADGERRAPIAAGLLRPARPAAARRRRSVAPRAPAARAPRGPGCLGPMQDSCVWRPPGVCLSLGRPLPTPLLMERRGPKG